MALEVLRSGPIARAELARKLGLSSGSLTRLTRPLIARRQLVEGTPQLAARTGRPSLPLDVVADSAYFIGAKITEEAVFAVLTDLRGDVIDQLEEPLGDHDPDATLEALDKMIKDFQSRYPRIRGVGIGLGGQVEDRRSARAPILGWDEVPLADEVARLTGLPCTVENDVKAFTQAEHWFGAGRGLQAFVVITVGAGIGCGIVAHDQLLRGRRGVSGAVGHLPLDSTGPRCDQGHRGCARAFLTSDSVARQISKRRRRPTTFEQCLTLLAENNVVAVEVLTESAYRLGVLAAMVGNVVAPERMLLSGEGIGYALLAPDVVRLGFADTAHWTATDLDLVMEPLEFFEWARGAAAVAIQTHVLGYA